MTRPWRIEYEDALYQVFFYNNPLRAGMVKRLIDYRWSNTNLQIGELFGLTHSSVSRRVTIIRKKMALEPNFKRQVEVIKSQIKP